jgi:hypothetical protein
LYQPRDKGSMTNSGKTVLSILALCILGAATYFTMYFMSPPKPQPPDASAKEFSAGRAMQDLAIIAREPHPMGISQSHAEVRDYIMSEIRALGLEPQLQDTFGLRVVESGWAIAGEVENILVRLSGTDSDGAILLMAHYDSAPEVPGAADNGSGVVTILEILRALSARPPLRHDVIFFFVDGEEPGTIGAHAFVDQHSWFEEVKLVLNLDTITYAPPSIIRTSGGNGVWVQALARSAPRPPYVSLPYHLFPMSDTDLLPFTKAGVVGADVVAMGAFPELHTALDQLEVVAASSVQHTGDQLLALISELGNQPTLDGKVPDQTFFPILGKLAHYPIGIALPLASVAGLGFLGTLVFGLNKKIMTWTGIGLGFLTFLLGILLSVGVISLLWQGIQNLHPEYGYSALRPRVSDDFLYAIGFIILIVCIFASAIALARKKISNSELVAGTLVFWFVASIAAAILVPISSYLGSWVLLAGSLALMLSLSIRARNVAWIVSGIGFSVSAVLVTFLWLPVVYIGYLAGSPQLLVMVAMASLWIGSLIPILDWSTTSNRWMLPFVAALFGAGYLIAGHFLVGKDSSPPLVNPVGYWLDAGENQAYWVGFAKTLDERQQGLLADPIRQSYAEIFPEAPGYPVLVSHAPLQDQQGPQLRVVKDAWNNDRRFIQLEIMASMQDRVYVIVPGGAPVLAITIQNNDKTELPVLEDEFVIRFDGVSADGIELGFDLDVRGSFQILVVEEKTGLPSFPGLMTQPQPGTMRTPGEFYQGIPTDFTAIYRAFTVSGAE